MRDKFLFNPPEFKDKNNLEAKLLWMNDKGKTFI